MCVDDHLCNLLDWHVEWCHPAECKHLSVQDEAKQSPALPAGHWAQGLPLGRASSCLALPSRPGAFRRTERRSLTVCGSLSFV